MSSRAFLILSLISISGAIEVLGWAQEENSNYLRLRHTEGPHDSSKALAISRCGNVAAGWTLIVSAQFFTAIAALGMSCTRHIYDKLSRAGLTLGRCVSTSVGSLDGGTVSCAAVRLLPVLDSGEEGEYCTIPDFGGGLPDMQAGDVSAEGSILAGYGNTERGLRGRRADTAVVGEDDVSIPVQLETRNDPAEQTLRSSSVQAVSADGTIIDG